MTVNQERTLSQNYENKTKQPKSICFNLNSDYFYTQRTVQMFDSHCDIARDHCEVISNF